MKVATESLSGSLQTLIDARLDTIDRMLLGRVPRADRLAIVREVESQIFELLHGQGEPEELSRDEVLAVLGRLDPPEAYLPEEWQDASGPVRVPSARVSAPARPSSSRAGKASFIVGLATLALVALSPMIVIGAEFTGSKEVTIFLWLGTVGTVIVGGFTAIGLAVFSRLREFGAVFGLVTGIFSVLAAIAGGIFLLLNI